MEIFDEKPSTPREFCALELIEWIIKVRPRYHDETLRWCLKYFLENPEWPPEENETGW